MYNHILITTDGSEVAQKGVDHGLALAKALGAQVTIITATERLQAYYPGVTGFEFDVNGTITADYMAEQKRAADATLDAAKQSAERLGITAETVHVPTAQPAEAIVETAKARNCSLIVMASHGRRGLGRLMLGSQTAEVLAHSPVPVLVVR